MEAQAAPEIAPGHTAALDEYCLSPGCTSQQCQDYASGWREGRADLLDQMGKAVGNPAWVIPDGHVIGQSGTHGSEPA